MTVHGCLSCEKCGKCWLCGNCLCGELPQGFHRKEDSRVGKPPPMLIHSLRSVLGEVRHLKERLDALNGRLADLVNEASDGWVAAIEREVGKMIAKPTFGIGQKVRHRGSGQEGIVVKGWTKPEEGYTPISVAVGQVTTVENVCLEVVRD